MCVFKGCFLAHVTANKRFAMVRIICFGCFPYWADRIQFNAQSAWSFHGILVEEDRQSKLKRLLLK
jgi:hypothetical protein